MGPQRQLNVEVQTVAQQDRLTPPRGRRDAVANDQHIAAQPRVGEFNGCDELVDLADAAKEVPGGPAAAIARWGRQSGQRRGTAT